MSKYKEYFQMMFEANKEVFENFKDIHDHYVMEPQKYQKIYNEYAKRFWKLCRTGRTDYVQNLNAEVMVCTLQIWQTNSARKLRVICQR